MTTHTQMPLILIIEDEEFLLEDYEYELGQNSSYQIHTAQTVDDARHLLDRQEYSVILTDIKLRSAEQGGLDILREVKKSHQATQVIIFTGIGGMQEAQEAQFLKADGFIPKPLDYTRLRQAVVTSIGIYQQRREAINRQEERRRVDPQQKEIEERLKRLLPTPELFQCACESMQNLINHAANLAQTDRNILIYGEAGTGKGLLAEGIHFGSERAAFELINCGSLSERTLEQSLFGAMLEDQYVPGLLARLKRGTLVLDRISGLSLRLQERLGMALQTRQYVPQGMSQPIDIEIRVIAIDDTDLKDEVQQGLFLESLHQLLTQETLFSPALRERKDDKFQDVLILAIHFIQKYNLSKRFLTLSPEAEYILQHYPFPGNVAELEKIIRVAISKMGHDTKLQPKHLPARMVKYGAAIGLGNAIEHEPVTCPHGNFYCNQASNIAQSHQTLTGIYLRLDSQTSKSDFQSVYDSLREQGLHIFPPEEKVKDELLAICRFCMPIQSSRFAVVDISQRDPQVLYEVGLLHALGIPTLLLKRRDQSNTVPLQYSSAREYSDINNVNRLIKDWLQDQR